MSDARLPGTGPTGSVSIRGGVGSSEYDSRSHCDRWRLGNCLDYSPPEIQKELAQTRAVIAALEQRTHDLARSTLV